MSKLLLIGASGLVGSDVLRRALTDARVSQVLAPSRKPLPSHAKLTNPVATDGDLVRVLGAAPVDAAICCLGTTIHNVGGDRSRFIAVDKDLVIACAQWARTHGARTFCLVSALGADARSSIFYSRVKGEVEARLKELGFEHLFIFQPSILTGPRQEKRVGERIGIVVMSALAPLMLGGLRKYRPMPHDVLAQALLNAALSKEAGTHTLLEQGIRRMATRT